MPYRYERAYLKSIIVRLRDATGQLFDDEAYTRGHIDASNKAADMIALLLDGDKVAIGEEILPRFKSWHKRANKTPYKRRNFPTIPLFDNLK